MKIFNRFYEDYLMPSRLTEYDGILQAALSCGYEVHSVIGFGKILSEEELNPKKKYLILRHDIDTDVNTAKEIFSIERKYGDAIAASYYFRLSTMDYPFMREIDQFGSEASYHSEEIAIYAKKKQIHDLQVIYSKLGDIQALFLENYFSIQEKTGLPMKTVASHGDFLNRRLAITNSNLITSEIREKTGIMFETYDPKYMNNITARIADSSYPRLYNPYPVMDAILNNEKVVYFLTHPRHWRASPVSNTKENLKRLWEGIRYSIF